MSKFMVFDVESIGLHGEGFAVGYVVVDESGQEIDQGYFACEPYWADGDPEGRAWVNDNVIPHLQAATHEFPHEVRAAFSAAWLRWRAEGCLLVADCGWPVEARFLAACVEQRRLGQWEGPYPLHDVATTRLAAGLDPLAIEPRRPSELPAHHPTADARQSARLWLEALNVVRGREWRP